MAEYRSSSHTVYDIKYHFVWITKYRYKILRGKIAERARDILRQGCEANGIVILKGSVGQIMCICCCHVQRAWQQVR